MQNLELSEPRYSAGSYGHRARSLFSEDHEWYPAVGETDPTLFSRAVTWTRNLDHYWVEQIAELSSSFQHKQSLQHRLFQVALLSIAEPFERTRVLERWYIVQTNHYPERIAHIHQVVKEPTLPEVSNEMSNNFNFIIQHGLFVPNSDDIQTLDSILEQGRMDGYDQLRVRP